MEITMITELVATMGFPIVAVIALGWFIWQVYKASEEREDKLMDEISETRAVNAQAISTIAKFADKIETIQGDIESIKEDISIIREK